MMTAVLDGTTTLERNTAAMARCSRAAVDLVLATAARPDAVFLATEDRLASGEPALSATIEAGERGAALLASRRRPLDEAERLAATVPVESAGGVVVMGFGLGYHVAAIARRMKRTGVIYIYEPDAALLRAVLERVDHSEWLRRANAVIFTDPDDTASLSAATRGVEGLLAMGVRFVEHPASLTRLGAQGAARFRERVKDAVLAVKTTVVTTLAQSDVTIRNLLMNLDHVVTRPGVADLAGCLKGRPAIVVSAGPSLRRNIEVLRKPGVRERFCIIAVQTVLKPLLARGIRPHFVTALDYHEISRRFYEGLTAADVEGVTLVAEAKANPAILDAFPGAVRVGGEDFLTDLLGPEMGGRLGQLPPGATVAHLAHYLARHMGCDPVILMGQDLGFTDGQYYAAGAAIHDVWACELNPFRSLEMMEWERIVRARPILRRVTDTLGRGVYTDEQMATYLSQFERDFLADSVRGLATIDATEGGVAKSHTRAMTLAEAVERYMPADDAAIPTAGVPDAGSRGEILARAADRVRDVRREVWRFEQLGRQTASWLAEMAEHHDDQGRVNRLIEKVHGARDEVRSLTVAPRLVERLNQIGAFKRVKADRTLELSADLPAMERQRRQIERDQANVSWIGDAAGELGAMLDEAVRVLGGGAKATRDTGGRRGEGDGEGESTKYKVQSSKTAVLVPVDPWVGGMGTARDLAEPFLCGLNPLQMMLGRLARCRRLDRVVLLAQDEGEVRRLMGGAPAGMRIEFIRSDGPPMGERSRAIRGARLWAGACWRGGPGAGTVFDEVVSPRAMADVARGLGLDAAVVVGADWALVDPGLVDALIERHLESPDRHRLTFTQAAPGLAPCVIEGALLSEFAGALDTGGAFASIGGLLGYLPRQSRLRVDQIAGPTCVHVAPVVRDAQARLIPDSGPRRAALIEALAPLGERVMEAGAEEIARLVAAADPAEAMARDLVLELCTGRRTSGVRAAWRPGLAEMVERAPMAGDVARRLIEELAAGRADGAVTFSGCGDPILHPDLPALVQAARGAGVGVHVRTDLVCPRDRVEALLEARPDVVSVDLMADSAATYRAVMGADLFEIVRPNLEHMLSRRGRAGGIPTPWIVPRITRCDAVYEEVESFYDRWLTLCGSACIDPLPEGVPGQRIEPLPVPAGAARRAWSGRMLVLCDGRVPASEHDLAGEHAVADASKDGLGAAWRRLLNHRKRIAREHGAGHPDLWTGV